MPATPQSPSMAAAAFPPQEAQGTAVDDMSVSGGWFGAGHRLRTMAWLRAVPSCVPLLIAAEATSSAKKSGATTHAPGSAPVTNAGW